ncbi:MAG: fused MFS/spermidine synthase [Verrucomicrobiales bacterium]
MSQFDKSAVGARDITPGLRKFLYFTAGFTGAAILIVEILGAKMLSPFIGTSHFVWTAQITVTLLSLAIGYYFGGRLVDKSARLSRLYTCLLVAALYLALTILVVDKVSYAFLKVNLALGALMASAALFFVPLTLLAATGPFLIGVMASSLKILGTQVGRLSAISTIGSVLGTLLIGYVLIPYLPNSVTMFVTSAALALLAIIYKLVWGKNERDGSRMVVLLVAVLLLGSLGMARDLSKESSNVNRLYKGNSNFGSLEVIESRDGLKRFYLNDYLVQNTYSPVHKESMSLFTYMLHRLAKAYHAEPKLEKVLCIGMGVGIVPMKFAAEGLNVEAVEINPMIIPVAEKYFDFDKTKVKVAVEDGRYYLNSQSNIYDAIILDAFLGDSSPSHLMTREAFQTMKQHLTPKGVLVINSFGDFAEGNNFLVTSLNKTLRTVFRTVRIHATGNGNVFFVATENAEPAFNPPSPMDAPAGMQQEILAGYNSQITLDPKLGTLLTDDYNPADFFDAGNRERHRRALAISMQGL